MAAYQRNGSERRNKGRKKALDDDQIIGIFEDYESRSKLNGTIAEMQAEALARYQGLPYGNEKPGRSQVMMRDVFEVIEWSKPSLLRIFTSGDEVVSFTPYGEEDVEAAEQDTDYTNLVVMKRNEGFTVFYEWLMDSLLLMNGYAAAYWCESTEVTVEEYEDLTVEQIDKLLEDSGADAEIIEQEELEPDPFEVGQYEDAMAQYQQMVQMAQQMPPQGQPGQPPAPPPQMPPPPPEPLPRFNIKIKKLIFPNGQLKTFCIPPERMMVISTHPSVNVQDADFVGYWEYKTVSELRAEGFDVDDDIGGADADASSTSDTVSNARNHIDPIAARAAAFAGDGDPALRTVKVRTAWARMDADGDGIAERRKLVVVGSDILYNEIDNLVTIASMSPILMPHRHHGTSVAQVVIELQEIKTALMRGVLDNAYLANNGRYAIDEDRVTLEDMLISRPGGVVRVAGDPSTAIAPLTHPALGVDVLRTIEYLDGNKEERTGISRLNQGLDANTLNKTARGQAQLKAAALERLELIARVCAETGIKNLFGIVHALLRRHQRHVDMVKMRGKWAAVNPADWRERRDAVPAVGLGIGDGQNKMGNLQMVITAQQGVMQYGLATPSNLYESLTEFTKAAGFKDGQRFWTKPDPNAPPPGANQPPDPKAMADMAKIQLDRERLQMEMQGASEDRQAEIQKTLLQLDAQQQQTFMKLQADMAKTMLTGDLQNDQAHMQRTHEMIQNESQRGADMDKQSRDHDLARSQQEAQNAPQNGKIEQIEQAMQQLQTAVQQLSNRPKKVKHHYDENGRIIGSEAVVDQPQPV